VEFNLELCFRRGVSVLSADLLLLILQILHRKRAFVLLHETGYDQQYSYLDQWYKKRRAVTYVQAFSLVILLSLANYNNRPYSLFNISVNIKEAFSV